jgi:hypothetical protein
MTLLVLATFILAPSVLASRPPQPSSGSQNHVQTDEAKYSSEEDSNNVAFEVQAKGSFAELSSDSSPRMQQDEEAPTEDGETNEMWMNFLFNAVADDDGKIHKLNWEAFTPGPKSCILTVFPCDTTKRPWREPMWDAFDADSDGSIGQEEFKSQWTEAIRATYNHMTYADGGGTMTKAQIEGRAWAGAFGYERDLALTQKNSMSGSWKWKGSEGKYIQLGIMSGSDELSIAHFEQVMFTAMLYQALDDDHDNKITVEEFEQKATTIGANVDTFKTKLPGVLNDNVGALYYYLANTKALIVMK